jgi:hypothetical protein
MASPTIKQAAFIAFGIDSVAGETSGKNNKKKPLVL